MILERNKNKHCVLCNKELTKDSKVKKLKYKMKNVSFCEHHPSPSEK